MYCCKLGSQGLQHRKYTLVQMWQFGPVKGDASAFWNRWTLDLHFGPRNAGLWIEILAQKHTKFAAIYLPLCVFGRDFRKSRSRVQHFRVQRLGPGSSDSKMPDELSHQH